METMKLLLNNNNKKKKLFIFQKSHSYPILQKTKHFSVLISGYKKTKKMKYRQDNRKKTDISHSITLWVGSIFKKRHRLQKKAKF